MKIDFCNYYGHYAADKEMWDVDSGGEVGNFFISIADEKEFDNNRENHVYMGWEGHTKVEYQAGKLVPLSNNNIYATKKDDFYAEIFHRDIK